jgi:hypothetical protein
MKLYSLSFAVLFSCACAHAKMASASPESCFGRLDLQAVKSKRLQEIVAEDQADRSHTPIDWSIVTPRDINRRIEVAEAFALGCIASAADYASAAMVYQHGDTADHAYQAFIWSKRAVDLGDATQKWLVAAALDRYLVRLGHKQLFATQLSRAFDEECLCLDPVEASFPQTMRSEYLNKTVAQVLLFVQEENKGKPSCNEVRFCKRDRKPSPRGTVPGFW